MYCSVQINITIYSGETSIIHQKVGIMYKLTEHEIKKKIVRNPVAFSITKKSIRHITPYHEGPHMSSWFSEMNI
jgi:hypothetical protein